MQEIADQRGATVPVACYGVVTLCAALAFYLLQSTIVAHEGRDSALARALGRDRKGKISPVLYASAIPLAFVNRWIAVGLYVLVAVIWFVPDRRLERQALRRHDTDLARTRGRRRGEHR